MLSSTASFGQKQTLAIQLKAKFDDSALKNIKINARAAFLARLCFLNCAGLQFCNERHTAAPAVLDACSIWGVVAYRNLACQN
jgi:hypothetical protein